LSVFFSDSVIPLFLSCLREGPPSAQQFGLLWIGLLLSIPAAGILGYLPEILKDLLGLVGKKVLL
jgi:hypothetical protein